MKGRFLSRSYFIPRVIYVSDDRPKILHEAEGSDEDDTTWGTMGGAASSTRVVSLELAKIGEKTGKGDQTYPVTPDISPYLGNRSINISSLDYDKPPPVQNLWQRSNHTWRETTQMFKVQRERVL